VNEDGMKFWDFGGTRITVLSIVPFIWIAQACRQSTRDFWPAAQTSPNWRAHFKKCKQLFEYQH